MGRYPSRNQHYQDDRPANRHSEFATGMEPLFLEASKRNFNAEDQKSVCHNPERCEGQQMSAESRLKQTWPGYLRDHPTLSTEWTIKSGALNSKKYCSLYCNCSRYYQGKCLSWMEVPWRFGFASRTIRIGLNEEGCGPYDACNARLRFHAFLASNRMLAMIRSVARRLKLMVTTVVVRCWRLFFHIKSPTKPSV
jgi:hypothetical protein